MSRIMIVDDDLDILKYCDAILSNRGHEVVTASSAQAALDILQTHNMDLLIVDIVMPRVSGFDLLKTLKQIKHFGAPVLMLTGRNTPKDVVTALDLGAIDYMCKPFDKDVLLSKIESILGTQTPAAEVQFAQGSAHSKAEVTLPAMVTSVSEMGLTIRTLSYIDRNARVKIDSPIFKDIGIQCPPLRAGKCVPLEQNSDFHYEVFVSFIGLNDVQMRQIRRWVTARTLATRKVS